MLDWDLFANTVKVYISSPEEYCTALFRMSCCYFCTSRAKQKERSTRNSTDISGYIPVTIQIFMYKELRSATDNFHHGNKLGRGGFGTVYKGVLKDGTQVAVKALSATSKQGLKEFLTEIDTVANVRHPNLVQVYGCCVEGNNRILVYEYAENNSLDRALLSSKGRETKLDWGKRAAICVGTAKGLAFLHEELEPPIVHRDIKASNILLDENFVPKIGDFGLAKLFPEDITHISTRVAGTSGYLAPEYALRGKLTKKADVYSFGVLVIEIVSGRRNIETMWEGTLKYLLERTWQLYEEGNLVELVDADIEEYSKEEAVRYFKVALFCTQASPSRRPNMNQVVSMLSRGIRLNEKELTAPGFYHNGETSSSSSKKKSSPSHSTNQMESNSNFTITQLGPR